MWKISDKPANPTILNLGFSIDPADDVLTAFILDTKVYKYPHLVGQVTASRGFRNELSSFMPYEAMDWEDIANAKGIEEDEVEICHEFEGRSLIKQFLFDEIISDYSENLLKVYRDNVEVEKQYSTWLLQQTAPDYFDRAYYLDYNANWALAMEEGLEKLKKKINDRWRKA